MEGALLLTLKLKDFQRQPEIHAMFAFQLSLEAAPHPRRRCDSTILKT